MTSWTGKRLAIFLFVAGLSFLFVYSYSSAAEPVDLLRLRDIICTLEPRGLTRQDAAFRRNTDGSVDLGPCQINDSALSFLGFLSSYRDGKPRNAWRDPRMIFDLEGSKAIALELLERSRVRLEAGKVHVTVFNLAHKYCKPNAKIMKTGPCARNAERVVLAYQEMP